MGRRRSGQARPVDRPMSERAPARRNPERNMRRGDVDPDAAPVVSSSSAMHSATTVFYGRFFLRLRCHLRFHLLTSTTTIFIAGCACADLADVLLLLASASPVATRFTRPARSITFGETDTETREESSSPPRSEPLASPASALRAASKYMRSIPYSYLSLCGLVGCGPVAVALWRGPSFK